MIRRAVRMGMQLGLKPGFTPKLAELVIHHPIYEGEYDELIRNEAFIKEQFRLEEERFQRTLASGIKEFERYYSRLTGLAAQIDSFAAPVTRLSREAVGRMEAETEALLAAADKYGIDILAHPGAYVRADVATLARGAAQLGVMLELNASRVTFTPGEARLAASLGARFVVNSDAHTPGRVGDFKAALDFAKLAGVPVEEWRRK